MPRFFGLVCVLALGGLTVNAPAARSQGCYGGYAGGYSNGYSYGGNGYGGYSYAPAGYSYGAPAQFAAPRPRLRIVIEYRRERPRIYEYSDSYGGYSRPFAPAPVSGYSSAPVYASGGDGYGYGGYRAAPVYSNGYGGGYGNGYGGPQSYSLPIPRVSESRY